MIGKMKLHVKSLRKAVTASTAAIILVVVIVILAILRAFNIGLTGAKPLREVHPWDWIIEAITLIIVIALLYKWWLKYKSSRG